jgi:hypothetical protein
MQDGAEDTDSTITKGYTRLRRAAREPLMISRTYPPQPPPLAIFALRAVVSSPSVGNARN